MLIYWLYPVLGMLFLCPGNASDFHSLVDVVRLRCHNCAISMSQLCSCDVKVVPTAWHKGFELWCYLTEYLCFYIYRHCFVYRITNPTFVKN